MFVFQVGSIAGTLVSGFLLHNFDGWGSVFYFFGGTTIVWFIVFVSIRILWPRILYLCKLWHFQIYRAWSATVIQIHIHSSLMKNETSSKKNWANWNVTEIFHQHHGVLFSSVLQWLLSFLLRYVTLISRCTKAKEEIRIYLLMDIFNFYD